ncbi:hypothetical protein [Erythrobacter sp.]|uniref:hypothetical protein n=1 Tax=Erythrobacter sp. TaxID=1042 RepID=UPI0025EFF4C4|nr:hypothetical protein [Erythrobacter sp.]
MRTALIAALRHSSNGPLQAAPLRATLPLAGRSVLARQVDLLRAQGCERILCLCDRVDGEVLRVQAAVEASGGTFQALRGFLHLPAMVRADDELVILADGLVPDPAMVRDLFATGPQPPRFVACLPAESAMVSRHPDDFERIDATRHWAGLLAMRGAPVQRLADFLPDADAISVLLRLALQDGTPCRELPNENPGPESWLLATDADALAQQEHALIFRAAGAVDWLRPSLAAARMAARALGPRALGRGPLIALLTAAALLLGGVGASALGVPSIGLALAAGGVFGAALAGALAAMQRQLMGEGSSPNAWARLGWGVDIFAAIALLLSLSPVPWGEPLAALGPVTIGLARLVLRKSCFAPVAVLADRAVLLAALALAAAFDLLPLATALAALLLLGEMLLRRDRI